MWTGSSLPIVVRTAAGRLFTKLRGAAQGTAQLIAEVLVAELAERIGLRVPMRTLVSLDHSLICRDPNAELADLLVASRGVNLGFEFLDGAKPLGPDQVKTIDEDLASQIVWLDALVQNVDRTAHNPNILIRDREVWLIDHGAALPFQYNWATVSEQSPRQPFRFSHLLLERASCLERQDVRLAEKLSRETLQEAVDVIPDSFLTPLLPPGSGPDFLRRRRAAYHTFLWKRLKPPRRFLGDLLRKQASARTAG
ncbi:MAG: hypothetical protein MJE77_38050 [Proteobacteria bacterium]|nr:hypothetical protein [Pseudomonadota bacterium]